MPADDQRRLAAAIAAQECWVIDSAYGTWRDVITARADYVVALDYTRLVSLSRVLRRGVRGVVTQEPMCHGNDESWGRLLGKEWIVRWHFRSFARKRATIESMESATRGATRRTPETPLGSRRPAGISGMIADPA